MPIKITIEGARPRGPNVWIADLKPGDLNLLGGRAERKGGHSVIRVAGEVQERESKLNGNPPFSFFLQSVCVDTGKGFNEGGLSVVNVSSRSENDMFHWFTL